MPKNYEQSGRDIFAAQEAELQTLLKRMYVYVDSHGVAHINASLLLEHLKSLQPSS